ncbi:hypothetical protein I6G79_24460 [Burkholderia plantarii]|nr:hypothetical protein [Burkholderia plantarii]
MDEVTQQNAALVEQSAAASLDEQASRLRTAVSALRLTPGAAAKVDVGGHQSVALELPRDGVQADQSGRADLEEDLRRRQDRPPF